MKQNAANVVIVLTNIVVICMASLAIKQMATIDVRVKTFEKKTKIVVIVAETKISIAVV